MVGLIKLNCLEQAGPGYMEEKHYDVGPDGKIVEVENHQPIMMDACKF